MRWKSDKSDHFTTKSLTQQLVSNDNDENASLYDNTREAPIPKKFHFLWEVSHSSINTVNTLMKKVPSIVSAPSWCVLCRANAETIIHFLVHCDFTHFGGARWRMLKPFDYHVAFPNDPLTS